MSTRCDVLFVHDTSQFVANNRKSEKLMRRLFTIFLLSLSLVGCGKASTEVTKEDIIESLAASGISGKEQKKHYGMIGAIDGFAIHSDHFAVEFYKFESSELAENCEICTVNNEKWGILVHGGQDYPRETQKKIMEIFNDL
mgnify:CR=1 FL=1